MSKDKQLPSLSAQELQEMKNLYAVTVVSPPANSNTLRMYRRLNELAAFAERKRVRLMVDAEQTYLVPFSQCFFVTSCTGTCSLQSIIAFISCSGA